MVPITRTLIFEKLLRSGEIIDIGLRSITLATRDCGRGKPRFIIYLPIDRNDIWELLWEKKVRVKVFLIIPEEELKKIGEEENAEKSRGRAQE
jgi:hypothetical protein